MWGMIPIPPEQAVGRMGVFVYYCFIKTFYALLFYFARNAGLGK
jgi:hypothetical protein